MKQGLALPHLSALLAISLAAFSVAPRAYAQQDIRLVLQITVDGLRGDLLNRYEAGFVEGGFRYLMTNGTVYTNAHFQHANTETIVGHTTLATGASPSRHGMVGNVMFNRELGKLTYNIEDADAPLLPSRTEAMTGAQVDPSQKLAQSSGRSPAAILVPTFGDGLAAYYAGQSKIFGISGKDRSAVAMAGHTGKAFWYSTDNGDFITSGYYYDEYPEWTRNWNQQRKAASYAGAQWALPADASTFVLGAQDDRPYEVDLKGYGRTFPHQYGEADNKLLFTQLAVSPVGDQLLLSFAKDLMTHEQMGLDSVPDYLSISFSSVDAVNHFFGASSLENEVVIKALDCTLAELLSFVDETVGLEHTLIALSADHGMPEMPETMTGLGYPAGRLTPEEIVSTANRAGQQLGIDEVVKFFFRPYVYLDTEKLAAANLEPGPVAKIIAAALTGIEGMNLAIATSNLESESAAGLSAQVLSNHHASRSGDIYVIQEPYWFLFDSGPAAVMHGSPWRYDTHVPIIFAGPGIEAQRVNRLVHPIDIAPTIAARLGLTPPAAAQGTPLKEIH